MDTPRPHAVEVALPDWADAVVDSGVRRVPCGATRDDAMLLRFDEGPVFASSWAYLERKGLDVKRGLLREEAVRVVDLYRELGGAVYNG
jgi:hypothetical protein